MKKNSIKLTKTLLVMGVLVVTMVSCKKEGCMDKTATNYNEEATKDDGSCTFKTTNNTTPNKVVTQLPNSSFENWENLGTDLEEPLRWSSLKTADYLAAMTPKVIFDTVGRNGSTGLKLVVSPPVFNIEANGIITTGRVHASMQIETGYVYTDTTDTQWNVPFNSRPDSLVGWYKYDPQPGDSGKIEIIVHKGGYARIPRDAQTINNELGEAHFDFITPQSDWTRFSAPFNYKNSETPDYILGVIQAGDSTVAQSGTMLLIDDVELIYNN